MNRATDPTKTRGLPLWPPAPTQALPLRVLELDRLRIERALRHRVRYRCVVPRVVRVLDGWRITSPCCSRNVDSAGGVIDIAWLRADPPHWHLYARDHAHAVWIEQEHSESLHELLDALCLDPKRVFWP